MENMTAQIRQLPNGGNILRLFNSAKQKLGNSALTIRDYNELNESDKPNGYGRYERDKGTIWVQMRRPANVVEYCLAHEIGHVMQDAEGFPRVSIKDVLRSYKEHDEHGKSVHPAIVVCLHKLSDKISSLLLDPGADSFARANNLLSRGALLYMEQRDLESIGCIDLPEFNRERLTRGINEALNCIRCGTAPSLPGDMYALLVTARSAVIYAVQFLRYSEEDLFDSLDRKYKRNQSIIRKLGSELLAIIRQYDLNTVVGCQGAAKHLIANLQLPSETIGLRTSQEWLT